MNSVIPAFLYLKILHGGSRVSGVSWATAYELRGWVLLKTILTAKAMLPFLILNGTSKTFSHAEAELLSVEERRNLEQLVLCSVYYCPGIYAI